MTMAENTYVYDGLVIVRGRDLVLLTKSRITVRLYDGALPDTIIIITDKSEMRKFEEWYLS